MTIFGMTFLPLLTFVLCPAYLFTCFAVILFEYAKWRDAK
jgi:hypothetical protein